MTAQQPSSTDGVSEPGEEQMVSFWFLANLLLRRRRLVLTVALVSAVAAGLVSRLATREYVASASFIPQEPRAAQSFLSQLAPQLGLALGRSGVTSPEFYVSLLQSRELQRDVVTTMYHSASRPFDGDLVQYSQIEAPSRERAVALAVGNLRSALDVSTDRNTGVVSFQVTTESPEISEQIANRLLDLAGEYNLRRQQLQARAEREFLEVPLEAARAELATAEDTYATFLARNRRFQDSPELVAQASRLERQVDLRQQLYLTLSQYHEISKLEEVRNTPVITVLQHPQGFVERKARGTVRKVTLAFVLGGLVGAFLAFVTEHTRRLQGQASEEYAEFKKAVGQLLPRVRLRRQRL